MTSVKPPAAVIVVEVHRRRLGIRRDVAGPVRAVDEEQVGLAVIIVVKKGDAPAHRLGQQLLAERADCYGQS